MHRTKYIGKGDFVYRDEIPIIIEKSHHSILINSHKQTIIDMEASNGTSILGYDQNILHEAINEFKDFNGAPCFVETELRLNYTMELNKEIYKRTNLTGKIAFENSGAGAIELAIRIARKNGYNGALIVFAGAYHGRTAFTGHLGSSRRYRDFNIPSPELIRIPSFLMAFEKDTYSNIPNNTEYSSHELLQKTIKWLSNEIEGHGIKDILPKGGIFIFEGIQNVSGMRPLDKNYLDGLIEYLKDNNTCIIADEIFTGFFRTGTMFYTTNLNQNSDIIVFSKGLTNGLVPLSALWGKEELMNKEVFPPGSYSSTYLNYPFGFAVALRVLTQIQSLSTNNSINSNLAKVIEEYWSNQEFQNCKSIYVCGNVARISLYQDNAKSIAKKLLPQFNRIHKESAMGILVATTGLTNNAINIHPAFNIEENILKIAFQKIILEINNSLKE